MSLYKLHVKSIYAFKVDEK